MTVQTTIQHRRDTAANWTSTNPTLASGEMGVETDTNKFKIGNGSSTWTALSYQGGGSYTLLTSGTLSGTQTSITGINQNYRNLVIEVDNWYDSGNNWLTVLFNGIYGNPYGYLVTELSSGGNTYAGQNSFLWSFGNGTTANLGWYYRIEIFDYAKTNTFKAGSTFSSANTKTTKSGGFGFGGDNGTAAITSVQFTPADFTSSWSGGNYKIYGVN